MEIKEIVIIGAGCPLANAIAKKFSQSVKVIGISSKNFISSYYDKVYIFNFLAEKEASLNFNKVTQELTSFVVVTCTGRFLHRKVLSNYTVSDEIDYFRSNVQGFTVPYRSLILKARQTKNTMFFAFGSVAQKFNYPMMSLYCAAKEALRSIMLTASHEESQYGIKFHILYLSTLKQDKEIELSNVSSRFFLPCRIVAENIFNICQNSDYSAYFSESSIYIHSDAYYKEGYLSRVK